MRDYEVAARRLGGVRSAVVGAAAWFGGLALSNRGLAVGALLACALISLSPWIRPAVSRDFRGAHIPWGGSSDADFLPQFVAEVPRVWSWGSIAAPVAVIAVAGAIAVAFRLRWAPTAFGLVLAVGLPATAAALWNHPQLIEFAESEVRGRILLRAMFRDESRDLLVGDSPDRLAERWGRNTEADLLPTAHPVALPFRYSVYGPWLVPLAALGVVLTSSGSGFARLSQLGGWAAVGTIVAVAITLPRWEAEYHFARADAHEASNRFAAAEASIESARRAMPAMEHTRRYWVARGRLAHRRGLDDRFQAYFEAHQLGVDRRYPEARALLEELVAVDGGSAVERELLSEFYAEQATRESALANYTAAEFLWSEANALTPWTPVHWLGGAATALWGDPTRADEIRREQLPRLAQVGDRVLNSDLKSVVGDAYFRIGSFREAREMYAQSLKNFNLPKHVNLRAQAGRLGM